MGLRKSFLWGGSTAANQFEGGYLFEGKGYSAIDAVTGDSKESPRKIYFETKKGQIDFVTREEAIPIGAKVFIDPDRYYPSHNAINFYCHYKEDIALLAEMGFKCFRLSISWARVCPTGKQEVNVKGLEFYDRIIDELLFYGIEPIVTINHFDIPLSLANDHNGWLNRNVIDYYCFFSELLFNRYKDKVKYWMTFEEINFLRNWSQIGIHNNAPQYRYQAIHHIFVASAKAVQIGHKINPNFKIGMMISYIPNYPLSCNPEDVFAAIQSNREQEFYMDVQVRGAYPAFQLAKFSREGITIEMHKEDLEDIERGTVDFIGFSYYMSTVSCANPKEMKMIGGNQVPAIENTFLEKSEWDWNIDPLGLRISLCNLYDRYQVPLFVMENGIGAIDEINENGEIIDDYRISYFQKHIRCMIDAVEKDGVDLMGYTTWAPIDLISSSTGEMEKRYGFIHVDLDNHGNGTFNRMKKKSFFWYKKVIETNGQDLENN